MESLVPTVSALTTVLTLTGNRWQDAGGRHTGNRWQAYYQTGRHSVFRPCSVHVSNNTNLPADPGAMLTSPKERRLGRMLHLLHYFVEPCAAVYPLPSGHYHSPPSLTSHLSHSPHTSLTHLTPLSFRVLADTLRGNSTHSTLSSRILLSITYKGS